MKRTLIIAVCALALLLAGAFWYFRDKQYHVVITQKQIDDALQAKFPVSKTHLALFHLTYSNPQVTLLPDSDRIEIGLDAQLSIKLREESKPFGGRALMTTGLEYRHEAKQFFLANPEIKKLTLQGVPQQYLDKATVLSSNFVSEYLQRFPVYTLKATDIKTTAARLLLKDVQVRSNEVHVTLGL
jgi:hypothetical protein